MVLLDVDGIRDKSRKGIPVAPVGLTACNFSRHKAIKNFFRGRGQPFSPTELPCSEPSNFCFSASSFPFPPCCVLLKSLRDPAIIYTRGGRKRTSINIYSADSTTPLQIIIPRKERGAIIQPRARILFFLPTLLLSVARKI